MSDGTTFAIDLPVTGASAVDAAATSLDRLTDRLAAAGAASSAAAQAVASGEAAYREAETTADRAAKALERIGVQADAQRGKLAAAMDAGDTSGADRAAARLANLMDRQQEAAAKAAQATAAMNDEAESLDRLKASASAAASAEDSLSQQADAAAAAEKSAASATDGISESAEGGTGNMRALSAAFGKLGGPLGAAGSKVTGFAGAVQKMSSSVGAAGPYVALAVAIVAIAAAAVVATAAVFKFGVTQADAARTSALLSDGIAGSVAGGRELDATIHKLGAQVPQTREELLAMAGDLAKTGLKGDALSAALETAAVKAAKLKYGPDFAKQTLSLDNQTTRLKANISSVFSGLKIDALLEGISKLVGLFDSSSASGNAMKVVFESVFQPLVDGVTAFIPKMIGGILQFEIWMMKAAIAVKPFASKLELLGLVAAGLAAIIVGTLVAVMVASFIPIMIVVAAIAGLIEVAMYLGNVCANVQAALSAFGASITAGIGAAIDFVKSKFLEIVDYLTNTPLAQIGTDMVMGLVNGITGAGGAILTAITGAVQGAIDGAKKLLGIASPSKVFADIGVNTSAGMADGVDKGAGDVQTSLESMVAPPEVPAGPAPKAGAAKGGTSSGAGASFAGAVFNFYGVANAEDATALFEGAMTRMFEGDAAQSGGAVPV